MTAARGITTAVGTYLQHQGEAMSLVRGRLPEMHRPSNIGGAIHVLRPGVLIKCGGRFCCFLRRRDDGMSGGRVRGARIGQIGRVGEVGTGGASNKVVLERGRKRPNTNNITMPTCSVPVFKHWVQTMRYQKKKGKRRTDHEKPQSSPLFLPPRPPPPPHTSTQK